MPYIDAGKLKAIDPSTGKPKEDLIEPLMADGKKPVQIAARLDVYPNAIRVWLIGHGWYVDENGKWVKREADNANTN